MFIKSEEVQLRANLKPLQDLVAEEIKHHRTRMPGDRPVENEADSHVSADAGRTKCSIASKCSK